MRQRHFPALLTPEPKLLPKLRSTALLFLGKQVIDSPVDPRASLPMPILPGQVESQARISRAAELGVDYFLGIQRVAANTFNRLVLVHITGCIAPPRGTGAAPFARGCDSARWHTPRPKSAISGASRIHLGRDPAPAVVSDCHATSRIKLDWL